MCLYQVFYNNSGSQLTVKYLIYMRYFTLIIYESIFQGLSATNFEIFSRTIFYHEAEFIYELGLSRVIYYN